MGQKDQPKLDLWAWLPPLVFLSLLGLIYFTQSNQTLFLILNKHFNFGSDFFWANLTIYGDGLVVAALLFPYIRKRPDILWAMLWTAIIGTICLQYLKPAFGFKRPPAILDHDLFHIIGPAHKRKAFPSGHTTTIFNFITVWILLIRTSWKKWTLLGFGCLVGLSRIAVGVHWPADVLGGAFLGWTTAVGGVYLSQKIKGGNSKIFQWIIGILLFISIIILIFMECDYPQARIIQPGIAIICLIVGTIEFIKMIREKT